MAELGLLVGIAVTALQAISLIAVEVRHRRNLKPTLLSLGIPSPENGGYLLSHKRSTIGAVGLNFSVRNGKRWNPDTITT